MKVRKSAMAAFAVLSVAAVVAGASAASAERPPEGGGGGPVAWIPPEILVGIPD